MWVKVYLTCLLLLGIRHRCRLQCRERGKDSYLRGKGGGGRGWSEQSVKGLCRPRARLGHSSARLVRIESELKIDDPCPPTAVVSFTASSISCYFLLTMWRPATREVTGTNDSKHSPSLLLTLLTRFQRRWVTVGGSVQHPLKRPPPLSWRSLHRPLILASSHKMTEKAPGRIVRHLLPMVLVSTRTFVAHSSCPIPALQR